MRQTRVAIVGHVNAAVKPRGELEMISLSNRSRLNPRLFVSSCRQHWMHLKDLDMPTIDWLKKEFDYGYDSGNVLGLLANKVRRGEEKRRKIP